MVEHESPRPWRDLVLFALLACAVRLAFLLAMPRAIDSADAVHYLTAAQGFAAGDFAGFNPRIPVLYPLATALVSFAVPELEWAGRVVSLLFSVLTVLPVYMLTRDLHGRRAAQVAAAIVAVWPWLADYGCRVAPEALAVFLWFCGVWLFARALRRGSAAAALLAPLVFFGLHLARPEGTFLMLSAPAAALILLVRAQPRRIYPLLVFVVVGGALYGLHLWWMGRITGEVTLSYRFSASAQSPLEYYAQRGMDVLRAFTDLLGNVIPVMLGPYLLLFAGVGLFQLTNRPRDMRLELFVWYFALVQWGCAVLSTYAEPRYMMAVLIVFAIWAARGIAIIAHRASIAPGWRPLRFAPVGLLMLLFAYGYVATIAPVYLGRVPREPHEYRIAGIWMRDNLEPGLILTRKPQIGWYAGMPTTGPAETDSVEDAVRRGEEAGARYLVVDQRYTAQTVPGLKPLLDPANAPPALEPLRGDLSPYPDARVVIYRFRAAPAVPPED